MVKKLSYAVIIISGAILAACTADSARVKAGGVEAEYDNGHYHDYPSYKHSYGHCPPGHAKKGWC